MTERKPAFPKPVDRFPDPAASQAKTDIYRSPAKTTEPSAAEDVQRPRFVSLAKMSVGAEKKIEPQPRRSSLVATFPRIFGGLWFALGVWMLSISWDTLRRGGLFDFRIALFAPVMIIVGGYALVAGRPLERDGRPPAWWTLGLLGAIALAFITGLGLLVYAFR